MSGRSSSALDLISSVLHIGSRRDSGSSFGTTYPFSLSFSEDDTSTISTPSLASSPSHSLSRSFSFRLPRASFSPRKSSGCSPRSRPRITRSSTESVISVATGFTPPIDDCLTTLRTIEVKHARELRDALDTNDKLEALLELRQEELAGARNDIAVLGGTEGKDGVDIDPALIVSEFKTLNMAIKGFCASLVALYPPPTHTSIPTLPADHDLYPLPKWVMAHAESQYMSHRALLLACLEASTCYALSDAVFSRFHPGLRRDWDGMLIGLFRAMVTHEPQLACGRWRAQTYLSVEVSVEKSVNVIGHIVERIRHDLGDLCDLFRCEPPTFDYAALSQLVTDALVLHARMQRDVVAVDWKPIVKSADTEGVVTGFGLNSVRGVPTEEGGILREVKVYVEPVIVMPLDLVTV